MTNEIYDTRDLKHPPPATWLGRLVESVWNYFKELFKNIVIRTSTNGASNRNPASTFIVPTVAKNGQSNKLKKHLGSLLHYSIPVVKNNQRPANHRQSKVFTSKNYRQKPKHGLLRSRHRGKIR